MLEFAFGKAVVADLLGGVRRLDAALGRDLEGRKTSEDVPFTVAQFGPFEDWPQELKETVAKVALAAYWEGFQNGAVAMHLRAAAGGQTRVATTKSRRQAVLDEYKSTADLPTKELRVTAVCDRLGVSRSTVFRTLREAGEYHGVDLGGSRQG